MGTYIGTPKDDLIAPYTLSPGVSADPLGSSPSAKADVIEGGGGDDFINGGGGRDRIDAGDGDDGVISSDGGGSTVFGGNGDDYLTMHYRYTDDRSTTHFYGGSGNDNLYASAESNRGYPDAKFFAYGEEGNDTLTASSFFLDKYLTLHATATDVLVGGTGDDTYSVFEAGDAIIEKPNQGRDAVTAYYDATLGPNVEDLQLVESTRQAVISGSGNELNNVLIGNTQDNVLDGRAGNDTIFGSSAPYWPDVHGGDADTIFGGDGNDLIYGAGGKETDYWDGADTLYGDAGNDRIFGQFGDDAIIGGAGNDSLAGQSGNDELHGGAGNDHLGGGTGDDLLFGEAGIDVLTGREGADTLTGGAGNDRYVYESVSDSLPGAGVHDVLTFDRPGNDRGDVIDLAQIDADATKDGNQAFTFVSTTAALKAGQLHVIAGAGTNSLVQGEVDGKAGVDFEIQVDDGASKPGDWIAGDFIL